MKGEDEREMKRKRRKWQKEEDEVPIEKTTIKALYVKTEYSEYIKKEDNRCVCQNFETDLIFLFNISYTCYLCNGMGK